MFHANYFRTAAIDSIGDTAIAAILTTARWGVIVWEWYTESFFSARANARYEAVGYWVGVAAIVTYALGLTARIYLQSWVDAKVSASLPAEVVLALPPVEADPFCPTVNPLPVSVAPTPALAAMTLATEKPLTIRQLKAIARERKLRGYGDMTKAQLIQALAV